ncbi:hypothetical protein RhiirC2_706192 [Rhizophagus irregularis]|uniref:Uncharacterized protein n=1 Tax=Rhizophagus irregularis TaxID=588596 RepID=A0A2N1NVL6_9GLOM|nr:hypothetical protein RhiirC2_706192 [Rhizophagus irregularis]
MPMKNFRKRQHFVYSSNHMNTNVKKEYGLIVYQRFKDLHNSVIDECYIWHALIIHDLMNAELGQYPHLPPIEHVQIFINYVKFIINESLIRKKIIKRNLEFYDRRVPKRKAKAQETAEQWQARLNRESERKRAQHLRLYLQLQHLSAITQNSNFNNTTPFFFDIPPQMISFMQNSITNNPDDTPNSPPNTLFFPKQQVLSFDVN